VRVGQCISVIRAVEFPGLVYLLSDSGTVKRVILALRSSFKIIGTLWM